MTWLDDISWQVVIAAEERMMARSRGHVLRETTTTTLAELLQSPWIEPLLCAYSFEHVAIRPMTRWGRWSWRHRNIRAVTWAREFVRRHSPPPWLGVKPGDDADQLPDDEDDD